MAYFPCLYELNGKLRAEPDGALGERKAASIPSQTGVDWGAQLTHLGIGCQVCSCLNLILDFASIRQTIYVFFDVDSCEEKCRTILPADTLKTTKRKLRATITTTSPAP